VDGEEAVADRRVAEGPTKLDPGAIAWRGAVGKAPAPEHSFTLIERIMGDGRRAEPFSGNWHLW
jgi:hypothetical protein